MSRVGVVPALVVLSSLLAILWSKASAVYDWGNIGGRVDPYFEQWYEAMGPVAYLSLLVWLASIAASAFLTKGSAVARLAWVSASLAMPLVVGWASSAYFHRGFPLLSG